MKELKRNKETGIMEVWENGKKIDEIITMGNDIINNNEKENTNPDMSPD